MLIHKLEYVLEPEVHDKYHKGDNQRCHQHHNRTALKISPRGPTNLVDQFVIGVLNVIGYFTTHFSDVLLAGVERFELPSTVLETAILPLNYTPVQFLTFDF